MTEYQELVREIALFWDNSDVYGSVIGSWFPLAWTLQYERDGCPDDWRYRPGAGASELEEDTSDVMYVDIYREYSTDVLLRFGSRLNRLYRRLEHRQETY